VNGGEGEHLQSCLFRPRRMERVEPTVHFLVSPLHLSCTVYQLHYVLLNNQHVLTD